MGSMTLAVTLCRGGGGQRTQARSPPLDDVIHAYRTQWGNRGVGHSPASVESTRSSKTNMLLVLALCTFWDDRALKSVPSGELGVTKDKTSFAKGSNGQDYPHLRKSQQKGRPPEDKSGRPRTLFYHLLRKMSSRLHHMSRHGDRLSPVHKTGTHF